MKNKEPYKEECKFKVHPCNFKVEINEIKPFNVHAYKSIVLNLQVINHCDVNSCVKLKSRPMYGNLYLLGNSILIYKSTKRFSGLDMFQILVEDECGEMRIESVLINVIC